MRSPFFLRGRNMATTAELEDMVGYRLGLTISATSIPTTTDVQSWLWEAAKKVAKKADPLLVQGLVSIFSLGGARTMPVGSITGYIKPIALYLNFLDDLLGNRRAEYLPAAQFGKAFRNTSAFIKGTAEFPVYTVKDDVVEWYPYLTDSWSNSNTTLDEDVDLEETAIDVVNGAAITVDDLIKVGTEVMIVTAINVNTLTVTRAQYGTRHDTHSSGASIYRVPDGTETTVSVLEYIAEPTDAAGLDNVFDEVLVDYATMMAKLQDEELADAQVFGQLFEKEFGGGQK